MLVSIEQGAEGMHAIDEAIVATEWSDETALKDEALIEGAVQDAVPSKYQRSPTWPTSTSRATPTPPRST